MYDKKHMSVEELILIFESRGMIVSDKEKTKRSLSHINYYKIKELANPFFKDGKYENITFEKVITRFYHDKNLRVCLLHAIEEIELSFKTKLAYVLGKKFGSFGYLAFNNWCNKKEYCKHYIRDKEKEWKKYIKQVIKREENAIIKAFFEENPDEEFPPIWMVIEIFTFGDVMKLFELMSVKTKEEIADFYECTPSELEGWLKSLKFIRNLSAHNTSIIDSKIRTNPTVREDWKPYLFIHNENRKPTNRIALVIPILLYLLKKINPNYRVWKLKNIFLHLIDGDEKSARQYGFHDCKLEMFQKDKF